MATRSFIHFIDSSSRNRAELARTGFALGYHSEVYSDCTELTAHPPRAGVIVARDNPDEGGIAEMIERLGQAGIWLPLIAFDDAPQPGRIVLAVKSGALDYLAFPIAHDRLASALERIQGEVRLRNDARRKMIEARERIASLSRREREVLDWLAEGCSNKLIARELQISPRTVEIHRANMMTKLGARHAAEAVRLKIEARMEGLG